MSDVEWYLEANGVRTGPFSARQIIEKMRSGQVAQNALVTTPRMQGDWVTVKDLAEAYAELNLKSPLTNSTSPQSAAYAPAIPVSPAPAPRTLAATPIAPSAATPNPMDRFRAPPRPHEQLEASKLIVIDPEAEQAPDPTNSLFQAMQAIREKNQQKSQSSMRDSIGEPARPPGFRLTPQMMTTAVCLVIFAIVAYAVQSMLRVKKTEPEPVKVTSPTNPVRTPMRPIPAPVDNGNRLLSEGSVRTSPPVQRNPIIPRAASSTSAPNSGRSAEGYRRRDRPAENDNNNAPEDHFEEIETPPEDNGDGEVSNDRMDGRDNAPLRPERFERGGGGGNRPPSPLNSADLDGNSANSPDGVAPGEPSP